MSATTHVFVHKMDVILPAQTCLRKHVHTISTWHAAHSSSSHRHRHRHIPLTICPLCSYCVLRLTEVTCSIRRADENTNWNGLIFNLQTWNFNSSRGFCHFCESNHVAFHQIDADTSICARTFRWQCISDRHTCAFVAPSPPPFGCIYPLIAHGIPLWNLSCRLPLLLNSIPPWHAFTPFVARLYAYTNRLLYGSWKERKSKRKWCGEWSRLPLT